MRKKTKKTILVLFLVAILIIGVIYGIKYFSDARSGEAEIDEEIFIAEVPNVEKFVLKLGNADLAKEFKENFLAAKKFNEDAKAGKELVYAPVLKPENEEK